MLGHLALTSDEGNRYGDPPKKNSLSNWDNLNLRRNQGLAWVAKGKIKITPKHQLNAFSGPLLGRTLQLVKPAGADCQLRL